MPLRFLRGNYTRVALTVIALACGVAQVSGNDMIAPSALQAFVNVVDTVAGRASLQVSAGEGASFSQDVAATLGAVPGVERTVPVVSASAFTVDQSGELLAVQGFDVTDEEAVNVYELHEGEGSGFDDPKLPARDVDLAFINDVLHHIEHRAVYLKALGAYMKPNGRIAIIEMNKDDPNTGHKNQPELLVGRDEILHWMSDADFKLVEEHPDLFPGTKWFLIFGRK